jgi:hypothetical protein
MRRFLILSQIKVVNEGQSMFCWFNQHGGVGASTARSSRNFRLDSGRVYTRPEVQLSVSQSPSCIHLLANHELA